MATEIQNKHSQPLSFCKKKRKQRRVAKKVLTERYKDSFFTLRKDTTLSQNPTGGRPLKTHVFLPEKPSLAFTYEQLKSASSGPIPIEFQGLFAFACNNEDRVLTWMDKGKKQTWQVGNFQRRRTVSKETARGEKTHQEFDLKELLTCISWTRDTRHIEYQGLNKGSVRVGGIPLTDYDIRTFLYIYDLFLSLRRKGSASLTMADAVKLVAKDARSREYKRAFVSLLILSKTMMSATVEIKEKSKFVDTLPLFSIVNKKFTGGEYDFNAVIKALTGSGESDKKRLQLMSILEEFEIAFTAGAIEAIFVAHLQRKRIKASDSNKLEERTVFSGRSFRCPKEGHGLDIQARRMFAVLWSHLPDAKDLQFLKGHASKTLNLKTFSAQAGCLYELLENKTRFLDRLTELAPFFGEIQVTGANLLVTYGKYKENNGKATLPETPPLPSTESKALEPLSIISSMILRKHDLTQKACAVLAVENGSDLEIQEIKKELLNYKKTLTPTQQKSFDREIACRKESLSRLRSFANEVRKQANRHDVSSQDD